LYNAPSYKLAKFIAHIPEETLQLPYTHNIKNSTTLMDDLYNINIDNNTRLCSFDTENRYTNIPTDEINTIITDNLNTYNIIPPTYQHELLKWLNTTLFPELLPIPPKTIQTKKWTSHGGILQKHNIIGYYRYIHDILTIYNEKSTQIHNILKDFNLIHKNLKFTIEFYQEKNSTSYT
jgi:hypothetical protein